MFWPCFPVVLQLNHIAAAFALASISVIIIISVSQMSPGMNGMPQVRKEQMSEASSTALSAKHFSGTNVQTMSSKIPRQYVLPKIFHRRSKVHCVDSETFLSATNVSKDLRTIYMCCKQNSLRLMSSKISRQYLLTAQHFSLRLMSQKISRQYVLPKFFHKGNKLQCVDSGTFLCN